jgi:amidase
MPVSLQLVSKRLEEEKLLSMTATVLRAIYPSTLTSLKDSLVKSIKARL